MTVQVDTSLDSQKVANEIVHLLEKRTTRVQETIISRYRASRIS